MSTAPPKITKTPRRAKTSGPAKKAGRFTGPEQVYEFAESLETKGNDSSPEIQKQVRLETWVSFGLAGETLAFPITAVREVIPVEAITRVPHAPAVVRGIINVRGRVVPLVDLRARLGLPAAAIEKQSRIIIAGVRNRMLGLLVDSVDKVVRIDANTIKSPPADVMTDQSEYIVGVCEHNSTFLVLLDIEPVLLVPDAIRPAF